jgi:glycogen synthase
LVGKADVPFDDLTVEVKIYRYDDRLTWYFLDAQEYILPGVWRLALNDERFFSGRNHPYDVGSNAPEQWSILRRDALFFGAAVARALPIVGREVRWNVIMQDWQAATTALALASNSQDNHRLFLTLHNSYDSGPVWPRDLQAVGFHPDRVPGTDSASSVLTRVLPLVEKPIFTVSEQFARDFTEDIFQIHVMADHLQHVLRPPNLVGVNNGLFAQLAVPDPALAKARARCPNYAPLREWKRLQKQSAIQSLRAFKATTERPVWGDLTSFTEQADHKSDGQLPWFVLAGRDDTRQKGYDVACHAIRSFLGNPENRRRAQFLFFPIPGDEGRDGLSFLEQLAQDFSQNALVLPFIFQEGYLSALQGAAFGIMPSLYEPFGMANEFYLNGAVGIGRATGGLLQQIIPLQSAASCTSAVTQRSGHWHSPTAPPTGFLYREPDDLPESIQGWRAINDVQYLGTPSRNRLEERSNLPLFTAMADALRQAIEDALAVYHQPADDDGQHVYFSLLLQGIGHLQRSFSWELAAAEYNSYMQ